jgi:hypothetical protein
MLLHRQSCLLFQTVSYLHSIFHQPISESLSTSCLLLLSTNKPLFAQKNIQTWKPLSKIITLYLA